jgi:hypothetical protein
MDPYPFEGHCSRCEDTGVTHTDRPSPFGRISTYAVPCKCTTHGQPMLAMLNRRFQSRPGWPDILTSNGVYQGALEG